MLYTYHKNDVVRRTGGKWWNADTFKCNIQLVHKYHSLLWRFKSRTLMYGCLYILEQTQYPVWRMPACLPCNIPVSHIKIRKALYKLAITPSPSHSQPFQQIPCHVIFLLSHIDIRSEMHSRLSWKLKCIISIILFSIHKGDQMINH